jgi:hypothetical protein
VPIVPGMPWRASRTMDTRAAFALLGLPPGSSSDAIRDAYRDLAKVWHPDRFTGDARLQAKASEKMRELNEAYRMASASRPPGSGAVGVAAVPAGGDGAVPPRKAATVDTGGWWGGHSFLPFDTMWRALFWAGACGVAFFVYTAPEGFFALGRAKGLPRPTRSGTAEAVAYARLPESDTGEATLVSRVRGTWVVAEHDHGNWLPAGTRLDVQGGTLSCAPPSVCDASFQPKGASRLTLSGAVPEDAREVDVLFASPTAMLWLVRPAANRAATPARIVLQAQGEVPASAVAP